MQLLPRGVLDVAGIRVVAAEVEGRDRDDPRIGGRVRPELAFDIGQKDQPVALGLLAGSKPGRAVVRGGGALIAAAGAYFLVNALS